LSKKDVLNLVKHKDGIAKGSWEIDVHPPDSYTNKATPENSQYDEYIDRVVSGDHYDIPYGCIVPKRADNLLVAGRCFSADYWAQGSARIQQTCISLGQAAGIAAVLSIEQEITPGNLEPELIIQRLEIERERVEPAFDWYESLPGCGKP
jgi:hypothetical protein